MPGVDEARTYTQGVAEEARARMVSFPARGGLLEAYLASPAQPGEGPYPGVVVIHEVFGLNDNIKDVAHRFAEEGYASLAVDLFVGRNRALCMARFLAGHLFDPFDHRGIRDLKAALGFLGEQPQVDGKRLGAIGFCLGGGLAVAWACADERLSAIAPYYGPNPRPLEAVRRSCPVVGSYPGEDSTAGQGRKLDAELGKHGVPRDVKIYPGAKHSFFNDRGRNHDPAASEDSWRRTLAFFGEHVAGIPKREQES